MKRPQRLLRLAGPARFLLSILIWILPLSAAMPTRIVEAAAEGAATPPAEPAKLIFIHHSCGENWLNDGNGGLGIALQNNNYFVSDTNYGWGPDGIGDRTDIPNWMEWYRSAGTPAIMAALYAESSQHSSYSRLATDPGGENEIIMFKSCFPNSALEGNPDDPPDPDGWLTVGHAKYVYNQLLAYFGAHPDKLFVVITAPPLISPTYAANARAFNLWLVNDWLEENAYALENVAVFDFYNILTGVNHHHRVNDHWIEHVYTPGADVLVYPTGGDDHPNSTGNQKATAEFVPMLNVFYHRWKGASGLASCPMFPANNVWNARIDDLPVHALSGDWIDTIGRYEGFHMDFGSGTWDGGPIGIPYNIADAGTPTYEVEFDYYGESDDVPYPIPPDPLIEYGSDAHLLTVDRSTCTLYELYAAEYYGGQWYAGSGAVWDLNSNDLRPAGWTSADAAGLPILPGLVRYDEIVSGAINHAIRFTAEDTNGYIWPARHLTSNDPGAPEIPPMGARFRLKAGYDISGFAPELQVILTAMKRYGIILADNGSPWYVSGAPDERWDNDILHDLDVLTGDDFEAVDESGLMVDPDSGEVAAEEPPGAFSKTSPADGTPVSTGPTLAWGASSGVETYYYCLDTVNNGICDTAWTETGSSTDASLSGLTDGTTYYWSVVAYNDAGYTYADGGTWWSFATLPDPPAAFGKTAPADGIFQPTDPTLSWTASSGADAYEYCYDTVNNGACDASWIPAGVSTSAALSGLATHATYYWQARATNAGGTTYADSDVWRSFKTPTFTDVPYTHPLWQYIEALYASGITTGCGVSPLIFCPEQNVTRAGMAVFLLRAKYGAGYAPPSATHTFADLPVAGKEWQEPWVDQFYLEGITSGCGTGPLIYCPENPVTRAAMAVFILRALEGSSYTPPAASHFFADMPMAGKEWMEPWVDEVYRRGITTGCGTGPLIFCPETAVKRQAMAAFIVRAFNLPLP